MARLIADVDYSNFKSAVAKRQGAKRENLYHGVWDVLHKLQGNAAFERPGQSSRSKVATDPAPKVAQANAYGGVLVDTNGLVLLREPTNHFGGYVWTFPKGRPDAGESPAEAALREVREETGYNARIICPIVGVFGGTTSTTAFFLMEPISEQGPTESETSQTRWVSFKDAPDLIAKTTVKAGRDRDLAVLNAAQKALAELPGR